MLTRTRVLAALLVVALLGGPLASLAGAQQQAAPAAPAAQAPAPDLFQASVKAEQTGAQQSSAYDAGAVVTNIFLMPGRAITCGLGAVLGFGLLAATLGSGYRPAAMIWNEGCGGRWSVTGDDLRPDGGSSSLRLEMESR